MHSEHLAIGGQAGFGPERVEDTESNVSKIPRLSLKAILLWYGSRPDLNVSGPWRGAFYSALDGRSSKCSYAHLL